MMTHNMQHEEIKHEAFNYLLDNQSTCEDVLIAYVKYLRDDRVYYKGVNLHSGPHIIVGSMLSVFISPYTHLEIKEYQSYTDSNGITFEAYISGGTNIHTKKYIANTITECVEEAIREYLNLVISEDTERVIKTNTLNTRKQISTLLVACGEGLEHLDLNLSITNTQPTILAQEASKELITQTFGRPYMFMCNVLLSKLAYGSAHISVTNITISSNTRLSEISRIEIRNSLANVFENSGDYIDSESNISIYPIDIRTEEVSQNYVTFRVMLTSSIV